ncbi:RNA polymerase sigma factor [Sphingobacterium sp. LRF_L2]|uniref:RNA polymerase sigma factor n=1 Tax=Sphingobacterium sp. LRF_L2 TaxID=3369421 RepID=UPI003F6132DE
MESNHDLEVLELIRDLAAGKEKAYRQVYERYKVNIYSTIFNLCDDEFVSEEVLQETFIRLWHYREKLTNVEDFNAWIYRVAKNVFLTKIRSLKPSHEPLDLILHDVFFAAMDYKDTEYVDLEKAYHTAIENLSPKQQLTYKMVKNEGLSRKEVAKLLNVSPETVKWNLDESVKKIRKIMIELLKDIPLVAILYYLQEK